MRITDQNVLLNALKNKGGTIDYIRLFKYDMDPIGDEVSITWDDDATVGVLNMTTETDISIDVTGTVYAVGLLSSDVGYTKNYIVTYDTPTGGSQDVNQYDYFRVEAMTLTITD